MNWETTDKFMLETRKVDNNRTPKAIFVNLPSLHTVTDMR